MSTNIGIFIKEKRKQLKLTQPELAERAGVGLRFVRELEQGKQTVQLDKVNQVLSLVGRELGVVQKTESCDKRKSITKMNLLASFKSLKRDLNFSTWKNICLIHFLNP